MHNLKLFDRVNLIRAKRSRLINCSFEPSHRLPSHLLGIGSAYRKSYQSNYHWHNRSHANSSCFNRQNRHDLQMPNRCEGLPA